MDLGSGCVKRRLFFWKDHDMSKMYSVNIFLDVEPNKKNFKKIAAMGSKLGIIFLKRDTYECMVETITEYLTLDEVADKMLQDMTDVASDINYVSGIACRYRDTYFILNGYKRDGHYFYLSFFILCNYWYKVIEGEKYFDFGRYVKLFVDLCEELPIMEIRTELDY